MRDVVFVAWREPRNGLPAWVRVPANLLIEGVDRIIVKEYLSDTYGGDVVTWKRQAVPYDVFEMIHELLYLARYSSDRKLAREIQKLFVRATHYELGPSNPGVP